MSRSSLQAPWNSINSYKRLLLSALTAGVLTAGFLAPPAHATGYVYQQHVVKAGILVNGSDPAPYLFYVLNTRPDVKPTDLTLVNPLASSTGSQNSAAYWEVPLNTVSDGELSQFDVLYLYVHTGDGYAPVINERLRRFVDNGGQLIVEYAPPPGSPPTVPTPLLFTGTSPAAPAASTVGAPLISPPATAPILLHPIVTQPYSLSPADVTGLGVPAASIGLNLEALNLFSPVLTETSGSNYPSVLSAAQIGAGQVIVSTLDIGTRINSAITGTPSGINPTADLKLLTNILAWSEAHPNENKSSHGNASGTGLASFSQAWQYPVTSTGTPSGAAVWGNFVFAVDAAGTLSAFDAYPSENLTGGATTDDSVSALDVDYSIGKAYDRIWHQSSVGSGASVPTLAAFGGVNYVFVETANGTLVSYNAVTGTSGPTFTSPGSGGSYTGRSAPSPTYYDGRLYAGQADGTLQVYDLNELSAGAVTGVTVPLDPNSVTGEMVTGPPSVGTLTSGDTNVLVAVVPTNYNVYSVLLGARNEPLNTYTKNGALQGYSINRLGRYDLNNIFADLNAVPSLLAYDSNGNIQGIAPTSTPPSPQDPLFAIINYLGYSTDWNMDFAASTASSTYVNMNFISASSAGAINNTPTAPGAVMSAPAIDRHGDYYYTETNGSNSYLVGVQNAPLRPSVHIKFRFLIPQTGANPFPRDADNVDYMPIAGFHFVGSPVIDDNNNVYAAATNGTKATVLCFRGDQQVSAIIDPNSTGPAINLTQATLTQPDESGGADNSIIRGPDTNQGTVNATYGQFVPSTDSISFYNFGMKGRSFTEIVGDLTEPQSVTATGTTGTATGMTTLLMRTNLAWYVTPFPVITPGPAPNAISGLSLVGNGLFFTDGNTLYKLATNPLVGTGKVVAATPAMTPVGAGTVGAPPSVGGNVMVINGTNGIAALTRQVTVIADSGRILGVDGDGSAVWAVDGTTNTVNNAPTSFATKVPFSHPTALSQYALNDYLVADTGNNRCVRFDSAGNVQWELTRFQDQYSLLGTGQPLTLSQPTSVVVRQRTLPLPSTDTLYPNDTATYYLIADSGNDRVVEVADIVDTTGKLVGSHVLTWVSHTGDRDGRQYRYGSAAYYTNPATASGQSIAATVTNTRLAPLAAQTAAPGGLKLGPVSGDSAGGSIVVFNYPASPVSFTTLAMFASDLVYTTAGFYSQLQAGGAYLPYTIRNPRFLQLNSLPNGTTGTSPVASVSAFDFLYADDNGAFDLSYDTTKNAFVAGPDRLQFTTASYHTMTNPAFGVTDTLTDTGTGAVTLGTTYSRAGLPFIPTSIQALSADSQGTSPNTISTRRYLITQNYSQGELGSVFSNTTGTTTTTLGKIGGEIFEIDVTSPPATGATSMTAPGGFGSNETLSHPALTGPLTQPTFGIRLP